MSLYFIIMHRGIMSNAFLYEQLCFLFIVFLIFKSYVRNMNSFGQNVTPKHPNNEVPKLTFCQIK